MYLIIYRFSIAYGENICILRTEEVIGGLSVGTNFSPTNI